MNFLLLGSVAMTLSGCPEQDGVAAFSPSSGKTKVPINAVVRVRYESEGWVRPSDIDTKNFELTVCSQPGTGASGTGTAATGESAAPAAAAPPTAEKKDVNTNSAAAGTAIAGRVIQRTYNVPISNTDGSKKIRKRTDILFIPITKSRKDLPLQPATDYCFTASPVKDTAGNILQGGSTSFKTEDDSDFVFAKETTVLGNYKSTNTIYGSDYVAFQLQHPVHPDQLARDSRFCRKVENTNASGTTTGGDLCKDSKGESIEGATFYQIESFPEEEGGFVLAHYDVYAIRSNLGIEKDAKEQVFVRLALGKIPIQPISLAFTVSPGERETPLGELRKLLTKVRSDFTLIPVNETESDE